MTVSDQGYNTSYTCLAATMLPLLNVDPAANVTVEQHVALWSHTGSIIEGAVLKQNITPACTATDQH